LPEFVWLKTILKNYSLIGPSPTGFKLITPNYSNWPNKIPITKSQVTFGKINPDFRHWEFEVLKVKTLKIILKLEIEN
jgi:hypothetical protein